jgi:hypothetical protein
MLSMTPYRNAITNLAIRARRYAFQVGLAEDESLNALTGGKAGETFSLRSAADAHAGDAVACYVCWCLGWMVQRRHCPLTLAGQNIPPIAAVRALLWISLVLALPYLAWRWPGYTFSGVVGFLAVTIALYRVRKSGGLL